MIFYMLIAIPYISSTEKSEREESKELMQLQISYIINDIERKCAIKNLFAQYKEYLYLPPYNIRNGPISTKRRKIEDLLDENLTSFYKSVSNSIYNDAQQKNEKIQIRNFDIILHDYYNEFIYKPNDLFFTNFEEHKNTLHKYKNLSSIRILNYFLQCFIHKKYDETIVKSVLKLMIRCTLYKIVYEITDLEEKKSFQCSDLKKNIELLNLHCKHPRKKAVNKIYNNFNKETTKNHYNNLELIKYNPNMIFIIVDIILKEVFEFMISNKKFKKYLTIMKNHNQSDFCYDIKKLEEILELDVIYELLLGITRMVNNQRQYNFFLKLFIESILLNIADSLCPDKISEYDQGNYIDHDEKRTCCKCDGFSKCCDACCDICILCSQICTDCAQIFLMCA